MFNLQSDNPSQFRVYRGDLDSCPNNVFPWILALRDPYKTGNPEPYLFLLGVLGDSYGVIDFQLNLTGLGIPPGEYRGTFYQGPFPETGIPDIELLTPIYHESCRIV